MNVYDFDDTIYDGDSTIDFWKYCLKKQPSLLKYLPKQAFFGLLFALRIMKKQDFKQIFFSYFQSIDDIDKMLEGFWKENHHKIKGWYKAHRRNDDVIITASPEFLVEYANKYMKVKPVIGSPVDKKTGKYTGLNCKSEVKVDRFYEEYPGGVIDEFYSDSRTDSPLADISKKAFLVKGDKLLPW